MRHWRCKGWGSKKASPPTSGSCPYPRPQQPLVPKQGSTAILRWEPAIPKHSNRVTPWLTGSQENPIQGQRTQAGSAWESHTSSPLRHLLASDLGTQGCLLVLKIGSPHSEEKAGPRHLELTCSPKVHFHKQHPRKTQAQSSQRQHTCSNSSGM